MVMANRNTHFRAQVTPLNVDGCERILLKGAGFLDTSARGTTSTRGWRNVRVEGRGKATFRVSFPQMKRMQNSPCVQMPPLLN